MATLLITKQTGNFFDLQLDGGDIISSEINRLTTVGDFCHFKTLSGANIIKDQNVLYSDVTLIASGTFTFASSLALRLKLKEVGFFDGVSSGGGGGGGGVDQFTELLDTFNSYIGRDGQALVVNESELKIETVPFSNVSAFTDLSDTPNPLLPNKMIVTNSAGNALIMTNLPATPETYLNAVGTFHYSDLATQTTPLNATANVALKITNDTLGTYTDTSNAPYGVASVYNATTNQFDFSSLAIGDMVHFRPDLVIDLVGTNTGYTLYLKMGIGTAAEYELEVATSERKDTTPFNKTAYLGFDISNEFWRDAPAEFYFKADANATVKVNGYYFEILRKNINVIDAPYLTSLDKETFTAAAIDSTFTLLNTPSNVVYVVVNTTSLHPSQYTIQSPKTLIINDDLDIGDVITICYNYGLVDTASYTKAESDAKFNKISSVKYLGEIVPSTAATSYAFDFIVRATQAGTYTNYGGFTVGANSFAEISRVDGVFSISQTPLDITNLKMQTWTAKAYASGDQVNYIGKDWVSNAATVAGDIPGTSIKWVERLKFGREIKEINQKAVLLEYGKNLLNPLTIISGDISETTGVLSPNPASTWRYTNYIKVPSSTQVSIKLCYKIAEYDINKVFITGQVNASQGQKTITTNATTAFIVIYGYNTTFAANQVEISATTTTYEAFYVKPIEKLQESTPVNFKNIQYESDIATLKLINTTNTNENLLLERYKNLFNVATALSNYVLDSNGNPVSLAGWGTSDFIPITSLTSVSCNKIKRYAEYTESGVFIAGTYADLANIQYTKTTAANAKFIRISYILGDAATTQVEIGATSTAFENYISTLKVQKTQSGKSVNFISQTETENNVFKSKKLLAIGDSITAALNYQIKVGAALEMTVTTHALGGIGIIAMVDGGSGLSALTASQLTGIDFVTFFGGLNDRGTTDGVITDLYPTQNTLAGRYNYALDKIFTLAKSIGNTTLKVIAIAPHKCGKYSYIDADGDDEYPIGSGRSLLTQVDILKKVCQRKSVPVINLYELSGINEHTWSVFSATSLPTNSYNYRGEFANVGSLPTGVLNDAARVVGITNAYTHNGTSWVLGSIPYPYNSDQLHLSENGNKRIADIIVSQLRTIYNGY